MSGSETELDQVLAAELERKERWLLERGHPVKNGVITQRAVADLLFVDARTIRRYHELGGGPPVLRAGRHGRARYSLRDVVVWMLTLNEKADIADKAE